MAAASGSSLVVRCALKGDAPAILALQEALFPGDINQLRPDEIGMDAENRHITALVAEMAGAISGFLVLRERPHRPWTSIDFVGVWPQAAGRGIGGALLEAAFSAARRPLLRLSVRPSNIAARALYARHGFRHTATRKANYADGEDALVLMKWVGLQVLRRKSAALEKG